MKTKQTLIALAITLLAGSAFALGNGGNGGQGGAGGRGGDGGNAVGHGGHGGHGGNATAGAAAAASAASSANAAAVQGQQQGQLQGQAQGQQQQAISGGNKLTNEGNNAAQSTSVKVDAPTIPVATAYAAPLAASNGTCMGSSSVGGQGVTVGVSFGTTWTDAECNRRYNSIRMQELGQTAAAVALMCQDADVAAAMDMAGTPCPTKKAAASSASAAPAGFEHANLADPIIARRAGLPAPLAN